MYNIVLSPMAEISPTKPQKMAAGVVFLASSIYFYKHWIERMCARGAELRSGAVAMDSMDDRIAMGRKLVETTSDQFLHFFETEPTPNPMGLLRYEKNAVSNF